MSKQKIFLNLTNGLLYDGPFDGFIRIQSCHCEQKCWEKVIEYTDNNFLMWLALGKDIKVVDYSANKEVPRALYQGLEWIWFCCCKAWELPTSAMVKGSNCTKYFEEEWQKICNKKKLRLKYYRKFLNNPKKPEIISGKTEFDGNYEYFQTLVKTRLH
jgi:hypothetical protein